MTDERTPPPPWRDKTTPLARALRAGLERADLAAVDLDADQTYSGRRSTRGIVTGGFDFDPEELHDYAKAMGKAYTQALAESLAARMAPGELQAKVVEAMSEGLTEAGAVGFFAGMFAQGVVTGELEHREQLRDEHSRSTRDACAHEWTNLGGRRWCPKCGAENGPWIS